jgi:hypothetical protein
MSLHLLGVACFAAAADNPYFVMAGFAAITGYFVAAAGYSSVTADIVAVSDCVTLYRCWLV